MSQLSATARVPLRSSHDTDGTVQRVLGKLEANDLDVAVVRGLANSPNGLRPFVLMADALMKKAVLPDRAREIVILALAIEVDSPYEWDEHVLIGLRLGLSEAEIEALRAGLAAEAPTFDESERLALAAATELHRSYSLADDLWDRCVATWGLEGTIDLVLSVGWWGGLAPLLVGALNVRTEESS